MNTTFTNVLRAWLDRPPKRAQHAERAEPGEVPFAEGGCARCARYARSNATSRLSVERRDRLREDTRLWPSPVRAAYLDRLGASDDPDLGSPTESAAREEAEIAAGWHNGWPARPAPGGRP